MAHRDGRLKTIRYLMETISESGFDQLHIFQGFVIVLMALQIDRNVNVYPTQVISIKVPALQGRRLMRLPSRPRLLPHLRRLPLPRRPSPLRRPSHR